MTPDPRSNRARDLRSSWAASLWLLLIANVLVLLCICAGFLPMDALRDVRAGSWLVAVWLTYPWIYLLPAYAVAGLLGGATTLLLPGRPVAAKVVSLTIGCLLFAVVQLVALADQRVLELYGFHLNGFVWNLLTTRGGIAALGAGPETFVALSALAVLVVAAEGALAWASSRPARAVRLGRLLATRRVSGAVLIGLVTLTGFERISFGVSRVDGYERVLASEEAFPLYARTSFNHLAKRLGFEVARSDAPIVSLGGGGLTYPLHPLTFRSDAPRSNVVVLCSESLRADALTAENMPATWAFAQDAQRFTNHVSSGNGTRMGVFGLFYGLPGPYWFRFLQVRRGPALLGALQARGYDVRAWTADDFSYPEFDQTVFAGVDSAKLVEKGSRAPSWQRDRAMVGEIEDYLSQRDPAQPFFLYAFLESPHARYDFPAETALYQPYLESFDYVTMNLERDIGLVHNRYRNSVRHLDTQIERVLDTLRERGLLDSTVVVITGDHGEEFMEQGRWGHNSAFTEPQIRVPLVLRVPGREAGVVERFTSHLDLPATLLDALGVENPASDYSLGQSLLHGVHREYALVSDWMHVAYVDSEGKVVFSTRAASLARPNVSSRSDEKLSDPAAYLNVRASALAQVWTEISRFTSKR